MLNAGNSALVLSSMTAVTWQFTVMGLQMFHGIEESQRPLIKSRVISLSSYWPSEQAHERRPLVGLLGPVVAAASTAGRDRKWATHSLGEKKLETIKILKMGLGDSRPLGSRALFLGAISLFVSVVLRWNQPTVSPVTSPILLITSNYLYFRVQELSPSWRS